MTEEKKDILPQQKFKLLLISKNLDLIENYSRKITQSAQNLNIKSSGVKRYPRKVMQITKRKSPCGNGSNTWNKFELRLYKRSFSIECDMEQLKNLLKDAKNPAGVQFEVVEDE